MANPTYIVCPVTCKVTISHELSLPPLQLDAAQGGQIAGAILLVWAAGWAIRQAIRALRSDESVADVDH